MGMTILRVSLVLGAACCPSLGAAWGAVERNSNRPGSDFEHFDAASAQQCEARCGAAAQCKAWTWVKPIPPVAQGGRLERHAMATKGVCWLKTALPARVNDSCCDSGVKASAIGATALHAAPLGMPQPPAGNAAGTANQMLQRKPPAIASDRTDRQVPQAAPASGTPSAVLGAPRLHALPGPGVSPAQLDFATVWGGDVVARTVEVAPPPMALEGTVRVELGPHKVFRISEVKVLGPVGSGTRVQVDNRGVPAGGVGRVAMDRTKLRRAGSAQVDVPLQRGDTLAVTVQSAPVLEQLRSGDFNGTGPQHVQLQVTGQGWRASIPISATVGGEGVEASVRTTESAICRPRAYDPRVPERHALSVTLANRRGHSVEGELQLAKLPQGVIEDSNAGNVKYRLGPKASARLEIPYLLRWSDIRFAPDSGGEFNQPTVNHGLVRIVHGAGSISMPFDLKVMPGSVVRTYRGQDGLEWSVDVGITCDGGLRLVSRVFNPNLVVSRRYSVEVSWHGQKVHRISGDIIPAGVQTLDTEEMLPGLHMDVVRDNYEQMLREAPTVKVTYRNHAG